MSGTVIPAFLAASVTCIVVGYVSWQRRPSPGAIPLTVLLLSQSVWSMAYVLQIAFTDHSPSHFWLIVRAVGVTVAPSTILILSLQYTRRSTRLPGGLIALLSVEPAIAMGLVVTDPLHHLYLGGNPPALRVLTGGPALLAHTGYSYAIMVLAAAVLVGHLLSHPVQRRQTLVILAAAMLPGVIYLLEAFGFHPLGQVNSVPLFFTLSGIVYFYGFFRLGLFEAIPIARDALVEQLLEGIIVFGPDRRIIDINPAAMRIAGLRERCIGYTSERAFPGQMHVILNMRSQLDAGASRAHARTSFLPDQLVEASASRVFGRYGEEVATLLTLRDVTEDERLSRELEMQQDRLAASIQRSDYVLSAMSEGVILVDNRCCLLSANPAAERILDTRFAGREGDSLCDTAPDLGITEFMEQTLSAGIPSGGTIDLLDGRSITVYVTPLQPADSPESQAIIVLRDETERLGAERVQRDFVANISHELQTPLTGLSLLADTLPKVMHDDPERADEFLVRLASEVRRIVRLTNELMALSRIEALGHGHMLTEENVDVSELACDVVAEMMPLADAKLQKIELDSPEHAHLPGDSISIKALISGLMENAVRYTPDGGSITLAVTESADKDGQRWVEIAVRDNGPGIPEVEQDRIFERFYRIDKARSRDTGGHGLGLSIVKQAVERHGGTISVDSTPDSGSLFTARLPAAPLA